MSAGRASRRLSTFAAAVTVLAVAVPLVVGQAEVVAPPHATVWVDLPFSQAVEANNDTAPDAPVLGSCGQDHFTLNTAGGWFRFREEKTQNGCGEIRFPADVPAGARSMQVDFWADRHVQQPTTADLPVRVTQEFLVYGADGGQWFGADYFDAEDQGEGRSERFQYDISINDDRVWLAWYFNDQGVRFGQEAANPITGQAFSAVVHDIKVAFAGIPLTVQMLDATEDTEGDQRIARSTLRFEVPPELASMGPIMWTFHVPGTASLEAFEAPDGTALDISAIIIERAQGVQTVQVPTSVVAAHGAGGYTVQLATQLPLELSWGMLPLTLALMATPAVAALVALRGAIQFRHRAQGPFAETAKILWMGLWGLGGYYLALLGLVLATGRLKVMSSWPMGPEGSLLLLMFPLLTLGFLGVGLLWRRRLARLIEAQLAAEEAARHELERSNQDLEHFAYVASHDLQEPLRMVSSYMHLLRSRYGEGFTEEANEFIGYAEDGAGRMQAMVQGLLAFSRVDRQGQPFSEVDPAKVIADVQTDLGATISEAGATVAVEGLGPMHADVVQMASIFQNLIGNAIKFRGRNAPVVRVRQWRDGDHHHFEVKDNGIGIEPEHHRRIFHLFQRLHSRHEYEGTGIGLALCRRIVERHGGRMWVESAPGKGTTVHFTMAVHPGGAKGNVGANVANPNTGATVG